MLKNNGILPIDKEKLKTIAIIGPNADSKVMLKGNYYGAASKYTTILEGIQNEIEETTRLYYSEGCHLYKDRLDSLEKDNDRIAEVISIAERAEVVLLCLGLDSTIEGEEGDTGNSYAAGDKLNLELPKSQQVLLEKVLEVNKNVIVILGNGSALTLSGLEDKCAAIVEAWYPGSLGGQAVADILFGKVSPSAKLPITFYKNLDNTIEFTDYSMKNRTYKYIEEEPLYPFGYGLTYSKVKLENLDVTIKENKDINIKVNIENVDNFNIEEVIQVYIKAINDSNEVLNHKLCGFKRVELHKDDNKTVELTINNKALETVDNNGIKAIRAKEFKLYVGISQPDSRSISLLGIKPLEYTIKL